jgi:hypothetical protein
MVRRRNRETLWHLAGGLKRSKRPIDGPRSKNASFGPGAQPRPTMEPSRSRNKNKIDAAFIFALALMQHSSRD